MGDHMTKTQNYKIRIEENRQQITNMLSGADTHKRLNNINWLRHELSYAEPRTLFYVPSREQLPYLDYNSMKNLGTAYDYIIDNPDTIIDIPEICKLHSMLCTGTPIQGGYRPIVFNQRTDKQKYKDAIAAKAAGDTKKYTQYMYSCLLRTQNEIINLLKKSRVL